VFIKIFIIIVHLVIFAIIVVGEGSEKMKVLDLSKSIYELSKNDETFVEHMFSLGFDEIVEGMTLQTVGRFMTVKKGAKIKHIPLEDIIDYFAIHGYEIKE